MPSDAPVKTWRDILAKFEQVTWTEFIKAYFFWVAYLFVLTIIGTAVATVYNYFAPIDVTSDRSVLAVALLFLIVVIIDIGLLHFNRPSPTLIAIVIVLAPVVMVYKLFKDTEFIRIDRSTPAKLRNYIPPRFISG